MAAKVFFAETRVEAWLGAAEYLLANGDQLNVILDVASPTIEGKKGRAARELLDMHYSEEGQLPLHSVAETIFPGWEYVHRGIGGVYTKYPGEYKRLKKGSPVWGTYAHRLLSRKDREGNETNPLHGLVAKMRKIQHEGSAKYRACYEIGMLEGSLELSVYDDDTDGSRLRGAPCLTHLSFKLVEGHVHLTALYRSHDYRYKVPGNLLGLARLQAFVAREVDVEIGTLVVHSTLAYLEPGGGRSRLTKLLGRIREVVHE